GRGTLHVRSDSLLLVQQMLGNYKVKNPGLQPLHARARLLAHEIGEVTFEHVGRSMNAHADRLANTAMGEAKPGRWTFTRPRPRRGGPWRGPRRRGAGRRRGRAGTSTTAGAPTCRAPRRGRSPPARRPLPADRPPIAIRRTASDRDAVPPGTSARAAPRPR